MTRFYFRHISTTALLLFVYFAVCLIETESVQASPFYLTVERTYSDEEKPVVRLDYTDTTKPMLIRILRPVDVEQFLDGQLQISRSYEEPQTALNPGHYLLNGLNSFTSPMVALRGSFNSKFRTELKSGVFGKLLPARIYDKLTPVPDEIIHSAPSGFSSVKEFRIYLSFDEKKKGWADYSNYDYYERTYKSKYIELDSMTDGLYLVQAVQGNNEAQALLQVSSISAQIKQSTEQLIVRAIDRKGDVVTNARVSFKDGRGKWIAFPSATNKFGEAIYESKEGALDGKLIVRTITAGGRQAFASTDFLPVTASNNSVYIVTDRPIFKPGDEFFFKGAIRIMNKGKLEIPAFVSKEAKLTVNRSTGEGTDIEKIVAPLTDFGTFSGRLDLDSSQKPGLYKLIAEVDGKAYAGEFRVRDYVKPTFYLTMIDNSPIIVPGQKFDLHFRAKRYSGGIPSSVTYEVYVYRKHFEVAPFVAESGNALEAGHDYFGNINSTSALSQPERVYSSITNRISNGAEILRLDTSGEGSTSIEFPQFPYDPQKDEWIYTVVIKAVDNSGSQAVFSKNIYMTLSEAIAAVSFPKVVAGVGDSGLQAVVRSSFPDGSLAPNCEGNLIVEAASLGQGTENIIQAPFKTDDRGIARIEIPKIDKACKLQARAELTSLPDRKLSRVSTSQVAEMVIGGADGEAILDNQEPELFPASTILSPGETTKVLALLPTKWGQANTGTIWETIAGDKVFTTKASNANGRSLWVDVEAKREYGTGFFDTISVPTASGKYKEKTLAFHVIPSEKRLRIAINPESPLAEPNKPFSIKFFVKDSLAKPAVDTELAVTIVDKAVYAVQPEFRPDIFDFFFPIPRLNLSTFYSDSLQGYGYADLLRKPNFALSALKSQSKPIKRGMRDTAGWFPHLVTDENGEAKLTVDLPANLTEWVVTVLAVDKLGRIGDARDQFQSRVDFGVDALMPAFLRDGDTALGFLRFQNDTDREVRAGVSLVSDPGLSIVNGVRKVDVATEGENSNALNETLVPAKGEAKKSLEIVASVDGKEKLGLKGFEVTLDLSPETIAGGAQGFDIDLKTDYVSKTISAKQNKISDDANSLEFTNFEPDSVAKRVTVNVTSGLLGAALGSLPHLLSYPYGCTEQLVHSTIPNLVLLDVIQKAGIDDADLGPLKALAKKAKDNADIGFAKILSNMKSDGGFSLWPSDSRSECMPTLIALSALKYASNLVSSSAVSDAQYKASSWVDKNIDDCMSSTTNLSNALVVNTLPKFCFTDYGDYGYIPSSCREPVVKLVKNVIDSNQSFRLDELLSAYEFVKYYKYKEGDFHNGLYYFPESFLEYVKAKGINPKSVILAKIEEQAELFDPNKYLNAVSGDFSHLGFVFGPAQLEARVLKVLDPNSKLGQKFTKMLLAQHEDGMWGSTYDTAQVIFEARDVISEEAKKWKVDKTASQISVLKHDGSLLGELKQIPGGFYGQFDLLDAKTQDIGELLIHGLSGPYVLYADAEIEEKAKGYKPTSNGINVTRTLHKITPSGVTELKSDTALAVGDVVVSEVLVSRGGINTGEQYTVGRVPSEFVVLDDPTPSLAESEENEAQALADAKLTADSATYFAQIKDTLRYPDKVTRIIRLAHNGGAMKIYNIWKVNFKGQAVVPPATAFDMYEKRLNGSSPSLEIRVD